MSPDNDRADPVRPGALRRIGRAALSPWLSLGIGERAATLQRDLDEFRSGRRRAARPVRLDEAGGYDLDAMAFLNGVETRKCKNCPARVNDAGTDYFAGRAAPALALRAT